MKIILIPFLAIFLVITLSMTSCRTKKNTSIEHSQEIEIRNLIISYDGKLALDNLKKEVDSYGATILYEYNNFNSIAISIPKGKSIEKAVKHFEKVEGVLGVEKDQIMQIQNK